MDLHRIPLPDDTVLIEGAISLETTPTGVVPRRLDAAYKHQLPMEVDLIVSSPSGVRVAVETSSPVIGLELMATRVGIVDVMPAAPVTVDLVVDGELVERQQSDTGNVFLVDFLHPEAPQLIPGDVTEMVFDLPAGAGRVELWLPSAAIVELRSLLVEDGADVRAAAPDPRPRWVHHGSSISHCMEAHGPTSTWPAVAARLGDVELLNLGFGGQCHLDQWTARTIRDQPADLISLKVGINVLNGDTLRERTFPAALHGFLDTVRDGHPDVPFLVVSPIICPTGEDRAGPTTPTAAGAFEAQGTDVSQAQGALTLRRIRTIVQEVVAARRAAGDEHLHHLDGLELFGPDDVGDLPDGLHPNGAGYERMGERFAAIAFADGGPLAVPRP